MNSSKNQKKIKSFEDLTHLQLKENDFFHNHLETRTKLPFSIYISYFSVINQNNYQIANHILTFTSHLLALFPPGILCNVLASLRAYLQLFCLQISPLLLHF